jgi:hypothetical protein
VTGELGRMRCLRRYPRYNSDEDDGDEAAAVARACLVARGRGDGARSRHRDAGGGRRCSSARRTGAFQSVITTPTGMYWQVLGARVLANAVRWRAQAGYGGVPRAAEMLQDKEMS